MWQIIPEFASKSNYIGVNRIYNVTSTATTGAEIHLNHEDEPYSTTESIPLYVIVVAVAGALTSILIFAYGCYLNLLRMERLREDALNGDMHRRKEILASLRYSGDDGYDGGMNFVNKHSSRSVRFEDADSADAPLDDLNSPKASTRLSQWEEDLNIL